MDCLTPRAHVRTAEHIKKTLEARGYAVFFVPEVPTIIMGGGAQYPGAPGPAAAFKLIAHPALVQGQVCDGGEFRFTVVCAVWCRQARTPRTLTSWWPLKSPSSACRCSLRTRFCVRAPATRGGRCPSHPLRPPWPSRYLAVLRHSHASGRDNR